MLGGFEAFRLRLGVVLFLFISDVKLAAKEEVAPAPAELYKMNGVVVYAGKFCCVVNKADFNCC